MEANEERNKRVILYTRVSTKGQARDGFSLEQQLERLREYAAEGGYEVVEEISDPGYSAQALERPGLDRVRDLVEEGAVDIVLAQDADRVTRNPYHRGNLEDEFSKHGTRLIALDDWGDDSHEGQLLKFIRGWQARGEATKTAERSRRNKRKKARQGMIVGGPKPAYGYQFARNEKGKAVGYVVNEAEMGVVRRIFTDVASGKGLRPLKEELDLEGIPRPSGGKAWSRAWIKKIVQNDLYKPHTLEELAEIGVSAEVLGGLDPEKPYGVYRFDGIPVPIPDAGIPLEVVKAARFNVENNHSPSRAGDRFGELSGGILYCAKCRRRMQHYTTTPRSVAYHYYRCQTTNNGSADHCTMRTYIPAAAIEEEVHAAVSRLMDDKQYVLTKMEEHFAQKRKELSRAGTDARDLARRLEGIEKRWVKWQEAYEADAIGLADLKARRANLEGEREELRRELERVMHRDEELERLARTEKEMRKRIEATENSLENMTPEKRRELYQDLRLCVEVGEDKHPRITGVFPIGRTEDGTHTLYVSRMDTSSARRGP